MPQIPNTHQPVQFLPNLQLTTKWFSNSEDSIILDPPKIPPMRARLFLVIFFVVFKGLHFDAIQAQSLVGKWEGTSHGQRGMMNFDKNGYITFIMDNETMGGKKFTESGVELSMKYEFNDWLWPWDCCRHKF